MLRYREGGSINFTEINTINHFLNNRVQTLNDYNLETEGVLHICLVQLLYPLKAILVTSKVKIYYTNMFGSVSQNQFSSPKAILDEATIPNF